VKFSQHVSKGVDLLDDLIWNFNQFRSLQLFSEDPTACQKSASTITRNILHVGI